MTPEEQMRKALSDPEYARNIADQIQQASTRSNGEATFFGVPVRIDENALGMFVVSDTDCIQILDRDGNVVSSTPAPPDPSVVSVADRAGDTMHSNVIDHDKFVRIMTKKMPPISVDRSITQASASMPPMQPMPPMPTLGEMMRSILGTGEATVPQTTAGDMFATDPFPFMDRVYLPTNKATREPDFDRLCANGLFTKDKAVAMVAAGQFIALNRSEADRTEEKWWVPVHHLEPLPPPTAAFDAPTIGLIGGKYLQLRDLESVIECFPYDNIPVFTGSLSHFTHLIDSIEGMGVPRKAIIKLFHAASGGVRGIIPQDAVCLISERYLEDQVTKTPEERDSGWGLIMARGAISVVIPDAYGITVTDKRRGYITNTQRKAPEKPQEPSKDRNAWRSRVKKIRP